jgi:ATP-dependent DNA helicase RecQ
MAPDRHDDDLTRQDMVERLKLEAQHFVSPVLMTQHPLHHRRKMTRRQLLRFIENEHAGEAGIVYCQSRKRVDEIASTLADHGPEGAGLPRWTRPFDSNGKTALREDGDVVMVATIAGMGID